MNRVRAIVQGIVLVIAVAVVAPRDAAAQFFPTVTPIVYCKATNEALKTIDIYLGYASSYAEPVTLPVGVPDNFFFQEPEDRNQPTTFLPGIHPRVFVTTFAFADDLAQISWLLHGNSITVRAFNTIDDCTHPFAEDGPEGLPGLPGATGPAGPAGPNGTLRTVTASGSQSSAVAACNVDEAVVSGGGSCSTWILGSAPSGNGWSVRCQGSNTAATANALCIRK